MSAAACWLAVSWLAAAPALLAAAAEDGPFSDLRISVVEPSPEFAQQLAAAVDAGLQAAREAAMAEAGVPEGAPWGAPAPAAVAPVEPYEPITLPRHVCEQAEAGAAAALAGAAGAGGAAAAARAGLPLLLVAPSPLNASAGVLALYPHDDALAEAVAELARAKGWRRAALLHERGPAAAAAAARLAPDGEPLELAARLLPPPGDDSLLRNLLLVLKKEGWVNFIVWADAGRTAAVLDAAQRVGLLSERHSYLLPALDLHTQRLHDYSYGGANITGLMLFDPESAGVRRAMAAWQAAYRARLGAGYEARRAGRLRRAPPAALLLARDGAALLATAHARLRLPRAAPPACRAGRAALHAATLLNYVRSTEGAGASGALRWRWDGAREPARLLVAELARGGRLRRAGAWRPRAGLAWARPPAAAAPRARASMANGTFAVLVAQNKPYVMRTEATQRLSGNERYEGFCIELVQRLAELLHFNYTFVEQLDRNYTRMLYRLIEDPNIDFAITDLTITAEREKLVDFTTPFMNLGISILFLKPRPPEPDLWAFLLPFSSGVWLWLGVFYVGTSLVLYVVGRLCPAEWQNPHPCVEEPPALENQFTLGNAFWFNLGAVLLQGSEIAPVAYGTRAVASAWWLFALVITSSYTANLATLLAKKSPSELFRGAEELAGNDLGIDYGAKKGGSTYDFFRNSQNQSETYKKMYEHMLKHEMPDSNEEGIQRVMAGNYAFLMESTTIEYTIERNCAVTEVGDHLDSKVYGIAIKKNSPYRQALNMALLNLQEAGVLRQMKHVWWKEKHGGGTCKDGDGRGESEELSMKNFRGLWLVLAVGCALGAGVAAADLAWGAWRRPRDPAQPFLRSLWSELKFVFRFDCSVKPLQGPLSPPSTPTASTSERSERSERCASGSPGSLRSRGSGGGAAEAEGRPAESPECRRSSSPAASVRARPRRRSSMHAASVRLARHATPQRHAR